MARLCSLAEQALSPPTAADALPPKMTLTNNVTPKDHEKKKKTPKSTSLRRGGRCSLDTTNKGAHREDGMFRRSLSTSLFPWKGGTPRGGSGVPEEAAKTAPRGRNISSPTSTQPTVAASPRNFSLFRRRRRSSGRRYCQGTSRVAAAAAAAATKSANNNGNDDDDDEKAAPADTDSTRTPFSIPAPAPPLDQAPPVAWISFSQHEEDEEEADEKQLIERRQRRRQERRGRRRARRVVTLHSLSPDKDSKGEDQYETTLVEKEFADEEVRDNDVEETERRDDDFDGYKTREAHGDRCDLSWSSSTIRTRESQRTHFLFEI